MKINIVCSEQNYREYKGTFEVTWPLRLFAALHQFLIAMLLKPIPIKMAGFFIYFSQIYSKIFLKYIRRFSKKQIKCMYLHKINWKSRAGINGYFFIKNPLLWEWHFHKLLWKCPICARMYSVLHPVPPPPNNILIINTNNNRNQRQ